MPVKYYAFISYTFLNPVHEKSARNICNFIGLAFIIGKSMYQLYLYIVCVTCATCVFCQQINCIEYFRINIKGHSCITFFLEDIPSLWTNTVCKDSMSFS